MNTTADDRDVLVVGGPAGDGRWQGATLLEADR